MWWDRPLEGSARLSRCRKYRYALWRHWDDQLPGVLFIGLNPSTADENRNDPTLLRCMRFAREWGYGGVSMGNLFAYRATDPGTLRRVQDPVGRQNDRWLRQLAREAELVVAAWGNHGVYLDRAAAVTAMLPALNCLGMNRSGQPAHPLYQRADRRPIPVQQRTFEDSRTT